MITSSELYPAGRLGKPHGINGEVTALIPGEIDIDELKCIVLDIDGIFVPFFIDQWRTKSGESVLLKLEGISNEIQAKALSNKEIYILHEDMAKMGLEEEVNEGFYTADVIGFTLYDSDGSLVGEVTDYDDQTDNVLLLVKLSDGREVYVPLADDLLTGFDAENKTITLDLPTGIIPEP